MFKHLLIPTDGSELSEAAIQAGVQFAKSINAKVTGFHAMPRFHTFAYGPRLRLRRARYTARRSNGHVPFGKTG
jgi:nucleotide-binding universal stress UspA family protein